MLSYTARSTCVISIICVVFISACTTTPAPPGSQTQGASDIARLDNVKRIKYERIGSGEGGRSGTLYREFSSDPKQEKWYYEGDEDEPYLLQRDLLGNTLWQKFFEKETTEYSSPRGGNGIAPTEAELATGFGTTWETVARSNHGNVWNRRCALGSTTKMSIGGEKVTGIQWRCRTQEREHTLPSIQEYHGIYVNGIFRWVNSKRCWKHTSAATTCNAKPGIYDGYTYYKAVDIERAE